MANLEQAKKILKAMGMPSAQQNTISGMTLVALCGLTRHKKWSDAEQLNLTISKGIMNHVKRHYGINYAPNTRETFRRQVLHQFVQGRIADLNPSDPSLPTNSPRTHYAITIAALKVVRLFGTKGWTSAVKKFCHDQGALIERYKLHRNIHMVPVRLPNGENLQLSPGDHNEVQKAIVEDFAPRFAQKARLLYLGDTVKKDLHVSKEELKRLNIPITGHDKLPDIILYDRIKNWLFLVEAVTSHGPMSPKRILELEKMMRKCPAKPVYVSAFPNFFEFRKHAKAIAWDTEVWLCNMPDHMIHYNGDRFLGPRR